MSLEEQVTQAIARGYCHRKNAHKVMDPDLVEAMVVEVVRSFQPFSPQDLGKRINQENAGTER